MPQANFKVLYSDIGGVLGTNGWDTGVREIVCKHFQLDSLEIAARHRLMFDSYERGFMSFDEYLRHVFFRSPRQFSMGEIRELVYAQSVPWHENIAFFKAIKTANKIKLGLISNEGQGITEHRVEKFGLRQLADFMIISYFARVRKPDRAIWQLALDVAQVSSAESIYVDDRIMFAEIAAEMGFTAIHHVSLEGTMEQLARLGLRAVEKSQ